MEGAEEGATAVDIVHRKACRCSCHCFAFYTLSDQSCHYARKKTWNQEEKEVQVQVTAVRVVGGAGLASSSLSPYMSS